MNSDFFAIDMNALPDELELHAKNYYLASTDLAQARKQLEEAKAEFEVITAGISKDVRTDPGAFGIEKVTENSVQATIIIQEGYRTALQREIDARYQVEMHQAHVQSLTEKGRAIGKAVDLLLANFFSVPKVSARGKEWSDQERTDRAFKTADKKRKPQANSKERNS